MWKNFGCQITYQQNSGIWLSSYYQISLSGATFAPDYLAFGSRLRMSIFYNVNPQDNNKEKKENGLCGLKKDVEGESWKVSSVQVLVYN